MTLWLRIINSNSDVENDGNDNANINNNIYIIYE